MPPCGLADTQLDKNGRRARKKSYAELAATPLRILLVFWILQNFAVSHGEIQFAENDDRSAVESIFVALYSGYGNKTSWRS